MVATLRWILGLLGSLSRVFVVALFGFLGLAAFGVGHLMSLARVEKVEAWLLSEAPALGQVSSALPVQVKILGEGALMVSLLLVAVLAAYNLAVLAGRAARGKTPFPVGAEEVDPVPTPTPETAGEVADRSLAGARIGLVLAGGGAKGVYQAGAMKAIHEFLAERGALGRVRMVSGTSIGGWNALCWATGLLADPGGGRPSAHERWWKTTPMSRVVEPATYLPGQNHVLSNAPWHQHYQAIFRDNPAVRERIGALVGPSPPLRFYLTRSNVRRATLGFATNGEARTAGGQDRDEVDSLRGLPLEEALDRIEDAVFASMDLPPVFPFAAVRGRPGEAFEDGGVVDNLPMVFATELEDCDLVFVLPLNATFAEEPDPHSMLLRLVRVTDVRQGELERRSLQLVEYHNRQRRLDGKPPVTVLAVCPAPPLSVGTLDFGTPAGPECFDRMYRATRKLLAERVEPALAERTVELHLVAPDGSTRASALFPEQRRPAQTEIEFGTREGRR